MTQIEIYKILERHEHWLREDCDGWEDMRANLSGADLRDANFSGADLSCAKLEMTKNVPFIPTACPDVGSFIGWKKCKDEKIVKLLIPEDAKRSSSTTRKCRCSKATVVQITNIEGDKEYENARSIHDSKFEYRVGETVEVDDFCEDRFTECASGIHFFINRQEAVNYRV